MSLLDPRFQYKPFEYPRVDEFIDLISESYWTHKEVDFNSDSIEFFRLPKNEQDIIKRAMLAISQIEAAAVKVFWGNLYNTIPKPEFHSLGMVFGDSEHRHAELYSRLLDVLGLEHEFSSFLNEDVAKNRFSWLLKPRNETPYDIAYNMAIFAMIIESVSLFSQFLIMMYFRRFKGSMKNISNGINWTAQDESTHFKAGAWIVELLRKEYPEIDKQGFVEKIRSVAINALEHEVKMVDYILGGKELEFMSRDSIVEFIKDRINVALMYMKMEPVFDINIELAEKTDWFFHLVQGTVQRDFFDCRPVEYSVKDVSFNTSELF